MYEGHGRGHGSSMSQSIREEPEIVSGNIVKTSNQGKRFRRYYE